MLHPKDQIKRVTEQPTDTQKTTRSWPCCATYDGRTCSTGENIQGSGKDGRITKEDVVTFIESQRENSEVKESPAKQHAPAVGLREERRVPMTRLRAKIAERLLEAQHNAAMLTTFNEVNLKAVMDLRAQYKDSFEKKHGVTFRLYVLFYQSSG